ncbi:hypothetical protein B566_EDAN001066 [Ephemera danica]|nr:hypothetical protein B566_EDAN001066 [Ephemera danica]
MKVKGSTINSGIVDILNIDSLRNMIVAKTGIVTVEYKNKIHRNKKCDVFSKPMTKTYQSVYTKRQKSLLRDDGALAVFVSLLYASAPTNTPTSSVITATEEQLPTTQNIMDEGRRKGHSNIAKKLDNRFREVRRNQIPGYSDVEDNQHVPIRKKAKQSDTLFCQDYAPD